MYIYPDGPSEKRKKFDNFLSGFLPAMIIPFILIVLISGKDYLLLFNPFEHFMRAYNSFFFTGWMLMALIPNLVLFFFFYKKMYERAGYGLVAATLIYIGIIILKTV